MRLRLSSAVSDTRDPLILVEAQRIVGWLRTRRDHIEIARVLIAGYFQAFAAAASGLALAQNVGGTPEELQAQGTRRNRTLPARIRRLDGSEGEGEGIGGVSRIPITKPRPGRAVIQARGTKGWGGGAHCQRRGQRPTTAWSIAGRGVVRASLGV